MYLFDGKGKNGKWKNYRFLAKGEQETGSSNHGQAMGMGVGVVQGALENGGESGHVC